MKKLNILLILLTLLTAICKAQHTPIDLSVDGSGNLMRYSASAGSSSFGICIGIDKNTKWIEYHNMIANQPFNNYVFLKGTKTITIFGYLPQDSLNYYRYNIIENDNKILATDAIPNVKPKLVGIRNTIEINLGSFNIENKKLTIETYKISARSRVSTSTIYNKEIKAASIFWVTRGIVDKKREDGVFTEHLKDGFKFKIHDNLTVTDLNLIIKPADITFLYTVYLKNLSTGRSALVSNNWLYDYFTDGNYNSSLPYIKINASLFNEPGNYELQIIPKLPGGFHIKSFPNKTATFLFTVLPSDSVYRQKDVIIFLITGLAAVAFLVLVVFLNIRIRNKKAIAEQKQHKEIAQLQLDAVRSQLNPHFLFNALSGIQNLLNKMEIDRANRYLSKFARLTRNVLKNNELVTLGEEKELLDDYRQMEQMRFGFNYEILIDPNLDILNIQIPAMLLQPFVENAVKHGISNMNDAGNIIISIQQKDTHLEFIIADNGKGFDTAKQNDGLGLQLSKKRIALLNTIYKDSPIVFNAQSGPGDTTVRIILTHWL